MCDYICMLFVYYRLYISILYKYAMASMEGKCVEGGSTLAWSQACFGTHNIFPN